MYYFALSFLRAGAQKDDIVITTKADAAGREITLVFEKGEHYVHPSRSIGSSPSRPPPRSPSGSRTPTVATSTPCSSRKRAGTQGWRTSPDLPAESIRRPESLPYWSHKRGVVYPDGLFMPTRDNPADRRDHRRQPRGRFPSRDEGPRQDLTKFVDPCRGQQLRRLQRRLPQERPRPARPNYSGGSWGSGQPSIVYAATVDLTSGPATV